ncbi:NUDIX hydrolase [Serratia rubidaea]|uniref:Mutator mutT protein n=1 Tax=Serratia rubidaea TaxID=61652 RepID=A0A447QRC5_SERRU|nr:NUDIX hydrolase [Serratia rubidaea]MDC6120042.1 NUDIX hydrolase [Serratia rubidaea]MDK1704191.1 NUDIX hydrolase [Serratia rubidaea]VEA72548.1 mutator mutT protein [Serratia rubidaea]
MAEQDFGGAKIALLHQGQVLVYRRDCRDDIPWPGQWDLPGGGREGAETPLQCVQRETYEEFGLTLAAAQVHERRCYPGRRPGEPATWFMLGTLSARQIAAVRFGDEGQYWRMMAIEEFIHHPQGIAHLRQRLATLLAARTR